MTTTHPSTPGTCLGRALIGLVWVVLLGVWVAIGLEALLARQHRAGPETPAPVRPRYDRLHDAYLPFVVQHLHPVYLFFFPFDPAERVALSNGVVHLDADGFRGRGPAQAGDRAVAFLIGGSTAFGHFASSDATTISGHLNSLQADAFVVNAGVPSWNTTQELARVTHQLLAYEPKLIVSLDGANDVQILLEQHGLDLDYPPGTPESFHRLLGLVDDIRARRARLESVHLLERMFPNLTSDLRRRRAREAAPSAPVPEAKLREAAHRYVFNLGVIRDVAESRGARFVPIFQPVLWLHEHVREEQYGRGGERAGDYRRFRRLAFEEAARTGLPLVDFSRLFDAHFERVPSFDRDGTRDLADADIFVDPVHLSDAGNGVVAREILALLRGS